MSRSPCSSYESDRFVCTPLIAFKSWISAISLAKSMSGAQSRTEWALYLWPVTGAPCVSAHKSQAVPLTSAHSLQPMRFKLWVGHLATSEPHSDFRRFGRTQMCHNSLTSCWPLNVRCQLYKDILWLQNRCIPCEYLTFPGIVTSSYFLRVTALLYHLYLMLQLFRKIWPLCY